MRKVLPKVRSSSGFTSIELLAVIVILGVLGAVGVGATLVELRAARTRNAAEELAGWLEAVRRSAERGIPCAVQITPYTAAASANTTSVIATGTPTTATLPNNCQQNDPFVISSGDAVARYAITATDTDFGFTPRGTVSGATDVIEIRIDAVEGTTVAGSSRCVTITPPLGLIEVGPCA